MKTGNYSSTFRQLYNLTDVGFFDDLFEKNSTILKILDGFGIIPPEVTIKAPVNGSVITTIEDKYFYVGFTHLMFSGLARIEYDKYSQDWRVKKWPDHWTLVNPSFVTHRNLVTTMDGLVSLLDPSITIITFISRSHETFGWMENYKKSWTN